MGGDNSSTRRASSPADGHDDADLLPLLPTMSPLIPMAREESQKPFPRPERSIEITSTWQEENEDGEDSMHTSSTFHSSSSHDIVREEAAEKRWRVEAQVCVFWRVRVFLCPQALCHRVCGREGVFCRV